MITAMVSTPAYDIAQEAPQGRLAEVTEIAGDVQLPVAATVEIQDNPKPASVAELVLLWLTW
jgi:hypothetical protein